MQLDKSVGAARSRPPTDGLECSVEWHHVGDRTNSPALVTYCGFVPRGRLVAAPTNGVYDKLQFVRDAKSFGQGNGLFVQRDNGTSHKKFLTNLSILTIIPP